MQAISAVRYHGSKTNTAAALRYVRETMFTARNGDRANAKNVVLLVTDGSSDNGRETIKEARAARDANIHILFERLMSRRDIRFVRTQIFTPNFVLSVTLDQNISLSLYHLK